MSNFPCPCCGRQVFEEGPGSYDICAVCFWEDDPVQLRWPDWRGGANRPNLIDAQANYASFGAMEERFRGNVRAPRHDETVEDGWRRIDLSLDDFEPLGVAESDWPADYTTLYWWRSSFWRS